MQGAISLQPLRLSEVPEIAALAKSIWREHYTKIISNAQIEYMLQSKYTQADFHPYVEATDRWFDVLRFEGTAVGFLRCSQTVPNELKLEEIYLSNMQRGKGLGRLLLLHAEALARKRGCASIFLYVNRRNEEAVRAYRKTGYVVTEEKDFDIGNGFIMDDYLMVKPLVVASASTAGPSN